MVTEILLGAMWAELEHSFPGKPCHQTAPGHREKSPKSATPAAWWQLSQSNGVMGANCVCPVGAEPDGCSFRQVKFGNLQSSGDTCAPSTAWHCLGIPVTPGQAKNWLNAGWINEIKAWRMNCCSKPLSLQDSCPCCPQAKGWHRGDTGSICQEQQDRAELSLTLLKQEEQTGNICFIAKQLLALKKGYISLGAQQILPQIIAQNPSGWSPFPWAAPCSSVLFSAEVWELCTLHSEHQTDFPSGLGREKPLKTPYLHGRRVDLDMPHWLWPANATWATSSFFQ